MSVTASSPFMSSLHTKDLTEEQFDSAMKEFSRRLDERTSLSRAVRDWKLRPNYDDQWVLQLKTRLKAFDQRSTTAASK